jgi:uncharacterized membrane protein YcjF (UPF0283 family)
MASSVERVAAVERLAPSIKELDPAAQVEAVKAAIKEPDAATTNKLWQILVTGLLILLGIALIGLIYLLADDKTSDVALTAFTALLTGLVGLFAPSPAAKNNGGDA